MTIDLLVFGPHADDIEIGAAGTIARHVAAGARVGLCDLTAAELSTNGTPESRRQEAAAAARVLGAAFRENLGWPDGGITSGSEMLQPAIELIRGTRPRVIAIPYWDDRHPDHVEASRALRAAVFKSALRRHLPRIEPWRTEWVCHYFINDSVQPSFVVDVSAHYEKKRAALDCYQSQFAAPGGDEAPTRLNAPAFRQLIESRDAQFGARAGVAFAEGFVVREPIVRDGLFKQA